MAEAEDRAVEPQEARRRIPRWLAIVLVLAIVALAALGLAVVLADDEEDPAARWDECAERVDPPADRSARLEEFSDEEDEETARERLADEIREVEQRIEAECGERP